MPPRASRTSLCGRRRRRERPWRLTCTGWEVSTPGGRGCGRDQGDSVSAGAGEPHLGSYGPQSRPEPEPRPIVPRRRRYRELAYSRNTALNLRQDPRAGSGLGLEGARVTAGPAAGESVAQGFSFLWRLVCSKRWGLKWSEQFTQFSDTGVQLQCRVDSREILVLLSVSLSLNFFFFLPFRLFVLSRRNYSVLNL